MSSKPYRDILGLAHAALSKPKSSPPGVEFIDEMAPSLLIDILATLDAERAKREAMGKRNKAALNRVQARAEAAEAKLAEWAEKGGNSPDCTPPAEAEPAEAAPREEAQEDPRRCEFCGTLKHEFRDPADVEEDGDEGPCCMDTEEAAQEGGDPAKRRIDAQREEGRFASLDPWDWAIDALNDYECSAGIEAEDRDELRSILHRMFRDYGQARAAQGRKTPSVDEIAVVLADCDGVTESWGPSDHLGQEWQHAHEDRARAVLHLLGEGDEPGQEPGGV